MKILWIEYRQFPYGGGYRRVEAQLRFITNTSSGMGLMKCGNVVIPFDNTIEKGTDLYNLYNTNIHEKIAMEKKKNGEL